MMVYLGGWGIVKPSAFFDGDPSGYRTLLGALGGRLSPPAPCLLEGICAPTACCEMGWDTSRA